ncbi:hypothetical protein A2U01_0004406 [Trifolium medium]|uniref:Uncharacterized protein n=1 Tax=Trifolium medium TaxID=97028 RepID=A0A392M7Y1_9FABA|nr:hypothetical protein [Trifolium medium]
MANNHVQNSLHNTLQDETSSQLRQTAQHGTRTNAIVNTNGNNCRVNNGTHPVRPNGNQNANGQGNGNNGNNGNNGSGGRGGTRKTPLPMITGVVVTIRMRTDAEEEETITLERLHLPPESWNPESQEL